jgi:hypothetical protein
VSTDLGPGAGTDPEQGAPGRSVDLFFAGPPMRGPSSTAGGVLEAVDGHRIEKESIVNLPG